MTKLPIRKTKLLSHKSAPQDRKDLQMTTHKYIYVESTNPQNLMDIPKSSRE